MFEKLKQRWNVNGLNLVLIISTFALGGSLCGYAGRKLLMLAGLEKGILWIILYVLLITLLWPVCVLIISIPLGQFAFFKRYLVKVWGKMSGSKKKDNSKIINIAIFASGAGTNAQQIIKASKKPLLNSLRSFAGSPKERGMEKIEAINNPCNVALIVCNKAGAGVFKVAEQASIPSLLIEKERFFNGDNYLPELKKNKVDFIILAGFLWKMPVALVQAYPKKIINIHPALLPKYGGKGMYGSNVHEAVIAAREKESGITIHYVDELYDHGEIIFQATCQVAQNDTAITLAQKIHILEHANYPGVIAEVLNKQTFIFQ